MALNDLTVEHACHRRLNEMPTGATPHGSNRPEQVVWPNSTLNNDELNRPRLEVEFLPNDPEILSMSGETSRSLYTYMVTVVVDEKNYSQYAQDWADGIAYRFKLATGRQAGDFLNATGDSIDGMWVRQRPRTGPGFNEGTEYRIPVVIQLESLGGPETPPVIEVDNFLWGADRFLWGTDAFVWG